MYSSHITVVVFSTRGISGRGPLAQSVELAPHKRLVLGSSPRGTTIKKPTLIECQSGLFLLFAKIVGVFCIST